MNFPQSKNEWIGIFIFIVILIFVILQIALLLSNIFGIYKLVNYLTSPKVLKFIDITIENYKNK